MALSTFDCIASITEHSAGFAEATRGNLDAPVEHCPGWSVADLVWHLTEVHWFWTTVVVERPGPPPDESRRPSRTDDASLVDAFVAGALRLVEALRSADQSAACWTWTPRQRDVAFVTRHQVQEAAVHHWDAAHAAGRALAIDPQVATDSVEEFLTFSVPSDVPAVPARAALAGSFALRATDTGATWTVSGGGTPGTVAVEPGAGDGVPAIEASASDLILWLYDRTDVPTSPVPAGLVERFRALCLTD